MPDQHLTIPAVIDHTRDDLRRVDNTAAVHIIAIAGLAALIGEISADLPHRILVAVTLAALPAAATIVAAVVVLWPRHLNPRGIVAPGSWLHAARAASWKTLLGAYHDGDPEEYTVRQLWVLARIADRKYRWLRHSAAMLGATVVALTGVVLYGLATTLIPTR